MRFFCICLCAVFMWAYCGSWAAFAAPAADPVVANVESNYKNLTSLRAEFSQVLLHKESGGKEERKGILAFQKPLLVRWETTSPSQELLVVTATEIWNVFPEENKAYKYPPHLADDSKSIVRVVTGQSRLMEDFLVERKAAQDKEGLTELALFPKEPSQSMVELGLWVQTATGMIQRLRIVDFYGNENVIAFTSLQRNPKFAGSSFIYTPAGNMTVEDRTRSGGPEKPLMQ